MGEIYLVLEKHIETVDKIIHRYPATSEYYVPNIRHSYNAEVYSLNPYLQILQSVLLVFDPTRQLRRTIQAATGASSVNTTKYWLIMATNHRLIRHIVNVTWTIRLLWLMPSEYERSVGTLQQGCWTHRSNGYDCQCIRRILLMKYSSWGSNRLADGTAHLGQTWGRFVCPTVAVIAARVN